MDYFKQLMDALRKEHIEQSNVVNSDRERRKTISKYFDDLEDFEQQILIINKALAHYKQSSNLFD